MKCSKSARGCGVKHTKQGLSPGALLEVERFKKRTRLQRKAHFEVKSVKNLWSPTSF